MMVLVIWFDKVNTDVDVWCGDGDYAKYGGRDVDIDDFHEPYKR